MSEWVMETVLMRAESAWQACVRVTGYGPSGEGFQLMLANVVCGVARDKQAGRLERVV